MQILTRAAQLKCVVLLQYPPGAGVRKVYWIISSKYRKTKMLPRNKERNTFKTTHQEMCVLDCCSQDTRKQEFSGRLPHNSHKALLNFHALYPKWLESHSRTLFFLASTRTTEPL